MIRFSSYLVAPLIFLLFWTAGCGSTEPLAEQPAPAEQPEQAEEPGESIEIILLQLNDVYEIDGVGGGAWGGLDRVAYLLKELEQENPNTYAVIAGDLFSPSAMGTARVKQPDGTSVRLDGEQMVSVLNAMGLDYATLGNHEFDLREGPFKARLQESEFEWITSNVTDPSGNLFAKTVPHKVINATTDAGTVRIGLVGALLMPGAESSNLADCSRDFIEKYNITSTSSTPAYYTISNPIAAIQEQVWNLKGNVDILIALTHLALKEDIELSETVDDLDLILGGHEHENWQAWSRSTRAPIRKADANARTVYVHRLTYDTKTGALDITSQLKTITQSSSSDASVAALIETWRERAFAAFRADGLNPKDTVYVITEALDGHEANVRNGSTNLTELIADAMLNEAPETELSLYNSGSIRIDDVILPGAVTQYDVIRVLPFGGELLDVEMKGDLLECVLEQGDLNRGSGGFLQVKWRNGDPRRPLDPNRFYRVAVNDFLLTGNETGLSYLTSDAPDIQSQQTASDDLRQVLIKEMQRQ